MNGYNVGEVDLHSYIVTEDGRTFTAISRIPPSIGFSMQSLYLVTDILGWLFASPQTAQAKNGYVTTGACHDRTFFIVITWDTFLPLRDQAKVPLTYEVLQHQFHQILDSDVRTDHTSKAATNAKIR